jgi:CRP/FNR family transcriptional regulator
MLGRGEPLFRDRNPLRYLYVVRSGSLKSEIGAGGAAAFIDLHLPGDWLGLASIHAGFHPCSAVALEASTVCAILFAALESRARREYSLHRWLHRLMACEVLRGRAHLVLRLRRRPRARVAGFLTTLARRHYSLGHSPTEFQLSLSRGEIGTYLGLAEETVCRSFAALCRSGWIAVDGRWVRLHDPRALARLATMGPAASRPGGTFGGECSA